MEFKSLGTDGRTKVFGNRQRVGGINVEVYPGNFGVCRVRWWRSGRRPPRKEPLPPAAAPIGKAPIGKAPLGKLPFGKGPVVARY